jgi:hypothetical protein
MKKLGLPEHARYSSSTPKAMNDPGGAKVIPKTHLGTRAHRANGDASRIAPGPHFALTFAVQQPGCEPIRRYDLFAHNMRLGLSELFLTLRAM